MLDQTRKIKCYINYVLEILGGIVSVHRLTQEENIKKKWNEVILLIIGLGNRHSRIKVEHET